MHQQLIAARRAFKVQTQQIHNPSDRTGEIRVLIFLFQSFNQIHSLATKNACGNSDVLFFHVQRARRTRRYVHADPGSGRKKGCAAEY